MKQSRNTAAKSEILNLINGSDTALSPTEVQVAMDGFCDRVTVYRVLDRLVVEDAIHKIVNIDGGVKYAACNHASATHSHSHIHFSCQKCKSVICIEDVEPIFQLPEQYKVSEVNCTVSGICPQCA